jgi:hypothetical protein
MLQTFFTTPKFRAAVGDALRASSTDNEVGPRQYPRMKDFGSGKESVG